jgi:hypothetical protein
MSIKLVLRSLRTVVWQMLLAEAAALVFLIGFFCISEGVSHDMLVEVGETFLLVSKYFSLIVFFALLGRAVSNEGKTAMKPGNEAGRPSRPENQSGAVAGQTAAARASVVEPAYVTNGAAPDLPELDAMAQFEPAEHMEDNSIINPATGMPMVGGYEGFDSAGHTFGEGDEMPQMAPDTPTQMQLFS